MQSIIRFFFNIWHAQSNAEALAVSDDMLASLSSQYDQVMAENAALRQQASKRDSSGRFAPKNTGQ